MAGGAYNTGFDTSFDIGTDEAAQRLTTWFRGAPVCEVRPPNVACVARPANVQGVYLGWQRGSASEAPPIVVEPPPSDWPDATNTGHLHAPGYPGNLTPFTGSLAAGETYEFRDFEGATIAVDNVTFVGCRFTSNWTDGWNVKVDGNNIVFSYCTFSPMPVVVTAPPNAAWPSAGAGVDVDGTSGNGFEPYMIGHGEGYQYGIHHTGGGELLLEYCDMWGFANAMTLFHGATQKTVRYCWFHDCAAEGEGAGQYHQDGPGHLDGGGASNILIQGCTIASLGNTNAIAFQAASSGYQNVVVDGCFLSGFGYCVDMGHNAAGTANCQFINNTIATDIAWHFGPLYDDFSSTFSGGGNVWANNKLRVLPGTVPRPTSSNQFTDADDGKFVLPSGSYSTTDWSP